MNISDIGSGMKLAKIVFSLLTDPEAAIIKIIDDVNNTDSDELSEIKSALSKKVNCTDILIEPKEDGLTLKFIDMKDSVDVFAVNIAGFIYKLVDKVKPIASIVINKEDIEKILSGLSVINNEVDDTTFIEVPYKEGILSLEVKITEDNIAMIEIPIESERILAKLKEMKNTQEVRNMEREEYLVEERLINEKKTLGK